MTSDIAAAGNAPIYLAAHVHACATKNQVVLLDLKRNKYLGIGAAPAAALAERIEGWPRVARTSGDDATEGVLELLQQMWDAHMLTRNRGLTTGCSRSACALPTQALIDGYSEVRTVLTLTDWGNFISGAVRARMLLRRRSLEAIAQRVAARRHAADGPDARAATVDEVRQLAAKYLRMRTFIFTANDQCLFDSLALIEFLARYGVFPWWTFGVAVAPFSAHCWVQDESVVFNDSPENVCRFAPIMIV